MENEVNNKMKIAIVHDWLTGMRGGEKVLEALCNIFPEADIWTLLHIKGSVSETIESRRIYTSSLQKMPFVKEKYRYYLPLMPLFIKQFNLSKYDIVISTSHCVAKGVDVGQNAVHICYCFTPMRYIWDMFDSYFPPDGSNLIIRTIMSVFRPYLQKWDVDTSKPVDYFIAISKNIQERVRKCYNRNAEIIYPPVNIEKYNILDVPREDFYLMVTAFAPYKRIDLAIESFNHLGKSLKIIGTGQNEDRLKKIAGSNIEFLGWKSDEEIKLYYNKCRALIFPGEEDFGIVPVEVQACGRPVIAYGKGGALETVIDGVTGVFFYEQTVESLTESIKKFETMNFDRQKIRENSVRFGYKNFTNNFLSFFKKVTPINRGIHGVAR